MKNHYEIRGEVVVIFMNSPKYGPMEAIISTDKLEKVAEFPNTWYPAYDPKTKSFYAIGNMTVATNKRSSCGMHAWIMGLPRGKEVDHINHNTLDNTNENLRVLAPHENKQNKRGVRSDSKSGVRCVWWNKRFNKWVVELKVLGKKIHIGLYTDLFEAEKAAIEARRTYMPYAN